MTNIIPEDQIGKSTGAALSPKLPGFMADIVQTVSERERREVNNLLKQSLAENEYTPLTRQDTVSIRNALKE